MNVHPTSYSNAVTQRMRRGAHTLGSWMRQHKGLVSWFVWGTFVLLCIAWVQLVYQPPAAPAWVGRTVRVTVLAIGGLVVREWLSLRWEPAPPPAEQQRDDVEQTPR